MPPTTRSGSTTRPRDLVNPVEVIDGSGTPNGEFVSLRDAAVAVDDVSGKVYLTDDQDPGVHREPASTVYVFGSPAAYDGHLKRNVFDGAPSGLAVDNSAPARRAGSM